LPDFDVFDLDAVDLVQKAVVRGVGTILFNMAVNPVSGKVYVSNMDSRNHVRFSGVASRANTTVRGHVADQQITVVDGRFPDKRVLNKHLDFDNPGANPAEKAASLHMPLGMAVTQDGTEVDSFVPDPATHIQLSGGGPSGIALDEARGRAYVLTRFDNGISAIDLETKREVQHLRMFNPEPPEIVSGRKFLYDANLTSGNGNDSCSSCHVFGETDGLAWDLGEPDSTVSVIENVFIPISPAAQPRVFHPMKGPMATQAMRGLTGHGPMHWRGDRSGTSPVGDDTLEEAAFKEFNEAFDAFAALGSKLDEEDMQAFTDFAMKVRYPPNPMRELDSSLVGNQVRGQELYNNGVVRIQTGQLEVCRQCHTLDPAAGLFGTKGLSSDNSQQGERNFKIPHFRDQYQKVGMFGWGFNEAPATGRQIRGFSFNHNGATSSNFILADLGMPRDDLLALRAFLYVFPTESPPITGQQVTLTEGHSAQAAARIDLLIERGLVETPVPECDLVVKGVVGGESRGWVMESDGRFRPDRAGEPMLDDAALRARVTGPNDRLTYTCVPWGSGTRIGVDRDLDGILDGDEV
jgi:hypothetical protein